MKEKLYRDELYDIIIGLGDLIIETSKMRRFDRLDEINDLYKKMNNLYHFLDDSSKNYFDIELKE